MANHPSAEKRNRQRLRRAAGNASRRSRLRSALKAARGALETGDKGEASTKVALASKLLARAAGVGLIHARTASRVTSRIQQQLARLA